jgi:predicted nuclease of predicted toxin-antitoxin system
VKLLFDQNLSPTLVEHLADVYPDSVHVSDVGLDRALDREVWDYAHERELTVVTKDADFEEMSMLRGFPPHVVWIRRGNCTTREIENILRQNRHAVEQLHENPDAGVVELY